MYTPSMIRIPQRIQKLDDLRNRRFLNLPREQRSGGARLRSRTNPTSSRSRTRSSSAGPAGPRPRARGGLGPRRGQRLEILNRVRDRSINYQIEGSRVLFSLCSRSKIQRHSFRMGKNCISSVKIIAERDWACRMNFNTRNQN